MMTLAEKQLTNTLLIDELDLWDSFDSKSISEDDAKKYYQLIDDLIDSQINESISWLDSEEARDYFFNEIDLQKEIFDALEDAWDEIFDESYENVDDLLDNIYDHGKKQGYNRIRETIRYTDADMQAIRLAKDYNYHLIRNLTGDLQSTVKDKILQGIIMGDNPYNLAKTLQKAGVTPLKDSPFTARQRATMIAKTETSRMQNTGMVQSYLNEGYTEVKILTAEDSHVCTTCLYYAYHYNSDKGITYEGRGKERVHNIVELIKGGRFPPFHPVCRCTYLTVWETKQDAPSNPQVINLTPLSVTVRKADDELPEPTKEQLKKNLRPAEREKYEHYKRNIPNQKEWLRNNPDASPEEIAKHQKRLDFMERKFNELKKKALGGESAKPENKPKTPKKKEKPKVEEPTKPADVPVDEPKKPEVEEPPKEEPKPKEPEEPAEPETPVKVNFDETVSELRKDLPFSDETFDEIIKWSNKKMKNKTRVGREFNTETGEFIGKETRGRNGIVQFNTINKESKGHITVITKSEDSFPDITSLKLTRADDTLEHIFISEKEIWYVQAKESLGLYSVMGTGQADIQAVYDKVRAEVIAKLQKGRKNGSITFEDKDLFIARETSNGLLREFNTKEWRDKGFIVRRGLREDVKETKKRTPKENTKQTVDVTHIDKSKLTYDNLKTPEEIAAFYDLDYECEVNAKGKIVSQKFIDNMSYVDPSTGETFNHKTEINFDSTFVGPNRRKAKDLIDITNSGECKYDQKELVRIYKEAPEIYKFATGSITFTGTDRIMNRRFAVNELGNAIPVRHWEVKGKYGEEKYFARGVNSIVIPYLPLNEPHGIRGTARQTMYHEMSHCVDFNLMDKKCADIIKKSLTTGCTREEVNYFNSHYRDHFGISYDDDFKAIVTDERDYQKKNNIDLDNAYASWYGAQKPHENWAETGSMAAFYNIDDKTDAVQSNLGNKPVPFHRWIEYHKPTYEFAVNKIKSLKPSMFGYNSNIGVKTAKPKEKVSKPKTETTPTVKYGLNHENSFSKVKLEEKHLDVLMKHQQKRIKAKIEWGNLFNLENGKLIYADDVKGKSNGVKIQRPNTGRFGLVHNHPNDGGFSGSDMSNLLKYRGQEVCVATTSKGIWIARETEFAHYMKSQSGGMNDNTITELSSEMNFKMREISKGLYESTYKEKMANATSRKELNEIKKKYNVACMEPYNEWLLEEFAVGKRRDALVEIEFISNEELKHVKF